MSLIANEREALISSQLRNAIATQRDNVFKALKTILVNKNLFAQELL